MFPLQWTRRDSYISIQDIHTASVVHRIMHINVTSASKQFPWYPITTILIILSDFSFRSWHHIGSVSHESHWWRGEHFICLEPERRQLGKMIWDKDILASNRPLIWMSSLIQNNSPSYLWIVWNHLFIGIFVKCLRKLLQIGGKISWRGEHP